MVRGLARALTRTLAITLAIPERIAGATLGTLRTFQEKGLYRVCVVMSGSLILHAAFLIIT